MTFHFWTRLLALLSLAVSFPASLALASYDWTGWSQVYDTEYLGSHMVCFHGREYHPSTDTSTWYYSVGSGCRPEIKHWVLALCPDHNIVDAVPDRWSVGTDRDTRIYGIKWSLRFGCDETKYFQVTLTGNWVVGDVEVGIKAGKHDVYTGHILGPSCIPYRLEVEVSGLTSLTVDQPFLAQANRYASLGTLSVTVHATVNYQLKIYYEVSPSPSPAFTGDPLSFEYPTDTWTTIPAWPLMVPLPGFPGTPTGPAGETHTYPVRVDLAALGDRAAGEVFTFTVHVLISESSGP